MIRMHALAACCCLLIAACSRPAPHEAGNVAATPEAVAPAPAPKLAVCSEAIQVVLDRPSLIDAGDKPFAASRLAAFETKVASSLHAAADDACKTQAVRKALKPIRKIVVQSGSGATEATFYRAPADPPGQIFFQWAFNEAGLGVPERKDIESGLRCWADPDRKECADMGD